MCDVTVRGGAVVTLRSVVGKGDDGPGGREIRRSMLPIRGTGRSTQARVYSVRGAVNSPVPSGVLLSMGSREEGRSLLRLAEERRCSRVPFEVPAHWLYSLYRLGEGSWRRVATCKRNRCGSSVRPGGPGRHGHGVRK
jgi:hypothetical protein